MGSGWGQEAGLQPQLYAPGDSGKSFCSLGLSLGWEKIPLALLPIPSPLPICDSTRGRSCGDRGGRCLAVSPPLGSGSPGPSPAPQHTSSPAGAGSSAGGCPGHTAGGGRGHAGTAERMSARHPHVPRGRTEIPTFSVRPGSH